MKNSILVVLVAVAAAILTSWTPGAIGAAILLACAAVVAVALAVISIGTAAFAPTGREPDLPSAKHGTA